MEHQSNEREKVMETISYVVLLFVTILFLALLNALQ